MRWARHMRQLRASRDFLYICTSVRPAEVVFVPLLGGTAHPGWMGSILRLVPTGTPLSLEHLEDRWSQIYPMIVLIHTHPALYPTLYSLKPRRGRFTAGLVKVSPYTLRHVSGLGSPFRWTPAPRRQVSVMFTADLFRPHTKPKAAYVSLDHSLQRVRVRFSKTVPQTRKKPPVQ